MIENTKITLSDKELELVCNTDWIFTKHLIIEKIYLLFGNAAANMQEMVDNSSLSNEIKQTTPKIAKGENYRLLPYVMLDYPRLFDAENTMAVRTFFWWGNSISMHLLLSGNYKTDAIHNLLTHFTLLRENNYAVCISDTPWQHEFEAANYLFLKDCSKDQFTSILHRKEFIKLGKKNDLEQWDKMPEFLSNTFSEMMQMIK